MPVLGSVFATLSSAADEFDHPSWLTATATVAGYLAILLLLFLVLFVLPYLLFASL